MVDELLKQAYDAIKAHSEIEDIHIKEAAQNGADGGFEGFVYYYETSEFFQKNKNLIWELLLGDANELEVNIPTLIASFRGANMTETPERFECLLSWYTIEKVGNWLLDQD